jgi:hypothetical protein
MQNKSLLLHQTGISTEFIYVVHAILTKNTDYFTKHH